MKWNLEVVLWVDVIMKWSSVCWIIILKYYFVVFNVKLCISSVVFLFLNYVIVVVFYVWILDILLKI